MAISPNRMRTSSPDSDSQNDKSGGVRAIIIREVEAAMAGQLENYGDEGLKQWHAHLQNQLSEASHAHHQAKDWLKQVDTTRALARDEYRLTQVADKQKAWKGNVAKLKDAQDNVKTTKENYYRAAAAVEAVTRELKRRTSGGEQIRPKQPTDKPTAKRKRTIAPEEPCPYCGHAYTVRDGLSSKTDTTGDRLHLRKCQCREKTPPCRNCPKCKGNEDIMSHNDPTLQYQLCQLRFKCEICSCRCPGAGKWVEHDSESRQAYAARTGQRHGQLSALGWHGTVGMTLPALSSNGNSGSGGSGGADVGGFLGGGSGGGAPSSAGKRGKSGRREHLKRLPADIRAQVQVLQSQAGSTIPGEWQSVPLSISHATGSLSLPQKPMMGVAKPPPELPADVLTLVRDVFLDAAGASAESSVQEYLRGQRVTSLIRIRGSFMRDVSYCSRHSQKQAPYKGAQTHAYYTS
ncbi:hypothetical protein WJX84_002816 [Apatococcus fuscideae]|uniref:Uncharacterized protein n=1 Tax=Apatococcus fuscideae TaxID=2026836 RepID=A0AAW1SVT0_9CHLO